MACWKGAARRARVSARSLGAGSLVVIASACSLVGYPAGEVPPPAPASARPVPAEATVAPPPDRPPDAARAEPSTRSTPAPEGARTDAGKSYEVFGRRYRIMGTADGYRERGTASWYGEAFHGRPTASGETYDMYGFSAAHRTLPLHSWIEVSNLDNGRSLILRVNDRGPFADVGRRILDLSYGAARELGVVGPGLAEVDVRALTDEEVERLRQNEQR